MESNGASPAHSEPQLGSINFRSLNCTVEELRPHPGYIRHKLSVQTSKLAALAQSGELAFQQPLIITRDRFIVDGYARFEFAKQEGRAVLPCLEYDLNEQKALEWLIERHGPSHGLSDFIRTAIALDLEIDLRNKALLNMREGGRMKGLSTLTEAEKIDSRKEIARVARVSVGNVHKVKYILSHACPSLEEAARTGEVSIHRAYKWSEESTSKQLKHLKFFRIKHGLRRKARLLVAAADTSQSPAEEQIIKLPEFVALAQQCRDFDSIDLKYTVGPDLAIFVVESEELMRALTPRPEMLV